MRRIFTLITLATALAGAIAVPALHAQGGAAPAGPASACLEARTPQAPPAGLAEPVTGETGIAPVYATCTPSPLCPGSACDVDCKSRGALFGFCSPDQCCTCWWKH